MKNKGITLVALVVTIIILLILSGITIAELIGSGLFEKEKMAKEKSEIASIKEEIQTDILGEQAENKGNISDDTLKEILEKYGVLSKEGEKLTDKTLTTTKENYKIKVSDIFNGTTVKEAPKEPTFTTVANAPDISRFNKSNTYYVSWDLTSSPYVIDDTTLISGTAPSNWYDYTSGVNHWANIKTTGGGNDCYWVWIPRYAYCITNGYHTNTAGIIDIKFLQGTTNTPIDGSSITISNSSGSGNWNVHPAFWWDKDDDGIEDEGEQLTGIWVAKFEASSSSVSETTVTKDLTSTGGGNTVNLQVRVKPNVTSWRGINVNNMFTVCRNLTTNGNSLASTTNLDSHMMKNTEWGACAYLSRSVYGINGEVWNNPYYNNTTNYSPITGLCSNVTDGKNKTTTDLNETCKYNEGGNASASGNVYGIYDMRGGANEYVAGFNYARYTNSSIDILGKTNAKYVNNYTKNMYPLNVLYYIKNKDEYGGALYETSSDGSGNNAWLSSVSGFPGDTDGVVLLRRGSICRL